MDETTIQGQSEPPKSLDGRRWRLCIGVGVICFCVACGLGLYSIYCFGEEQKTDGALSLLSAAILFSIPFLLSRWRHRLGTPWLLGGELVTVLCLLGLAWAVVYPFLIAVSGHGSNGIAICLENQRQISVAINMYAQDNMEILPPADQSWSLLKKGYELPPDILRCPQAKVHRTNDYGLNRFLSGKALGDIQQPGEILLTADGGNAHNLLTGPQDIDTTRHENTERKSLWRSETRHFYYVTFFDGSAEAIPVGMKVRLQP